MDHRIHSLPLEAVMIGNAALLVSIKNNTAITALNQREEGR